MKYLMKYFGIDYVFDSIEEVEDYMDEEHAQNPDCIEEVEEVTDSDGKQYGFAWRPKLVEL